MFVTTVFRAKRGIASGSRISTRSLSNKSTSFGLKAKPQPGVMSLVGAPFADGQPIKGVEHAPDAFRKGGLDKVVAALGWKFSDRGDANRISPVDATDGKEYYETGTVKNEGSVGGSCGGVAEAVYTAAKDGDFVLTVGGDHSIGCGTLMGIHRARPNAGYIWVDAHADCNTPDTSPSGNYHGMPLAHVLGWFDKRVHGFEWCDDHLEKHGPIAEDRVAIIALRDVDEKERALLLKSNVHVFTMTDIDAHGIGHVMNRAIEFIDAKGRRPLHVSFDVDSCDPEVAPGTGTLARGGLSYREAHFVLEKVAATGRFGSLDLVEVNPSIDSVDDRQLHGDDPNIKGTATVRFAMGLAQSALGKTII